MANVENELGNKGIPKSSGCRRFSTAEKLLFVVAICGFVACVTLLVGLGVMVSHYKNCNKTTSAKVQKREIPMERLAVKSDHGLMEDNITVNQKICHEFCSSSICQNEASYFINNMNPNIDPCNDFYQFACGNFIKTAIIPDDVNKIDITSITQKKVLVELINEIKRDIQPNEISAFKKLKIYYQNCMNATSIQEEGTKNLLKILNNISGWPVLLGENWKEDNYSWSKTIYKLKDYGFPVLFPTSFYIGIDPKNSTQHIIKILNARTRVSRTYLLDGRNSKILKAYYDYMVDVAVMLGANKNSATVEMQKCLDFEVELHNIKSSLEILADTTATYNPITIKELSVKHPSIPWLEFINEILNPSGVSVNEDEIVIVKDLNFISGLEKLISRTPKRIIANYLMWQVVYDSIDYLPDIFLDRKLAFSRIVRGVEKRKSRAYTCVQDVMNGFQISLSALYLRRYFNKGIRDNTLELVQNVKSEFRRMLEKVDWMDIDTKSAAIEKMDSMDVLVGYSDEFFDDHKIDDYYKSLEINYGSYLTSAFNISLFFTKQHYANLRQPVNKKDWKENRNAAILNAYYYLRKNIIEIPAGILRGSFYHYGRPNYLNYGAIGSVIGHEITHGFDNEGRKIDKNGNQIDWWQASTKEKYLKKARCFVEQYNNYTVEEIGLKLNGNRTQGENIADNGGYKAAYYAYNEWVNRATVSEPCLPGLNYTARQMFWISAASNWCRKQKLEYLRDSIAREVHSPPVARVSIPFSNIREFSEDFQCPLGSKMNPEKKCIVW